MGVDYDLFWTLNPKSLAPFTRAFELKRKIKDREMWQHGIYIQHAIASAFNKHSRYPSKPFLDDTPERTMTPQEIKERVLVQMEIINMRFNREGGNNG